VKHKTYFQLQISEKENVVLEKLKKFEPIQNEMKEMLRMYLIEQ